MERETGNKGEEEEGEREENEERRRVHKILKVQISFIPHTELPLETHLSWSQEMRGNRCYSSQCLTADSCLVTPSARSGGGGGERGKVGQ